MKGQSYFAVLRLSLVVIGGAFLISIAGGSIPLAHAQGPGTVQGQVFLQSRDNHAGATLTFIERVEEVAVETVATNLVVPWALASAPDGRLFVTERPGRVRVIQDGTLSPSPFATLDVAPVEEAGLMGITIDPAFQENGHLYVCCTYQNDRGQLRNRVARLTEKEGAGGDHTVLIDDIPGARFHDGCRVKFGPDQRLYITMGDAGRAENAQNLGSLSGKVLRINADGSVPADNPFPGSPVFTYEHRNPQGIAWHPVTSDAFITEHGPGDSDEVNILQPGSNYGWPDVRGIARDPDFVNPIVAYTPTVALAGAAFYDGSVLPAEWQNSLFFTTLKSDARVGHHLHSVALQAPEYRVVQAEEELFKGEFGRLRDVVQGPDGYLYFTTSNRDGRGRPFPGDDKVLRIVPGRAPNVQTAGTGPDGRFTVSLSPGAYGISIENDGFLKAETALLEVGADVTLDLPVATLLAGDLDGDGVVGSGDISIAEAAFLAQSGPGSTSDLNQDGVIDVLDAARLASNWGRSKSPWEDVLTGS